MAAASLFTAIYLAVIYRLTINLTELPYSNELRRPGSTEFFNANDQIVKSFQHLLRRIPGHHEASVLGYRYHQVVGTLATVDIYSDRP
ncbi:unnamed protein product, partial [Anisakis simplex]|uniref:SEA domain-containing protein n=1 Tax=Anisakis simplex TaxID=6269 RepID=A0A0M3KIS6_ANISI